jgi:hypothetical protein
LRAITVDGGARLGIALPPLPMGIVRLGTGSRSGLLGRAAALGKEPEALGWVVATGREPCAATSCAVGRLGVALALAMLDTGGGITAMGTDSAAFAVVASLGVVSAVAEAPWEDWDCRHRRKLSLAASTVSLG